MNVISRPFSTLAQHDAPVQTIRVSNDGRVLLTGDVERQLKVWIDGEHAYDLDIRSKNQKVATSDRIRGAEFSPDGALFFTASGPSVQAFETVNGRRQWSYTLPRLFGFLVASPLCIDMDRSGKLAIANDNGAFGIRDVFGRKLRLWKSNAAPRWIHWTPDQNHLIGSDSFTIRLWDAQTGESIRGYQRSERAYFLTASKGAPIFAVRTLHSVCVYRYEIETSIAECPTREGLPLLAFSPNGDRLISSDQRRIQLLDVSESALNEGVLRVVETYEMPNGADVLSVCFSADGRQAIAGCNDGGVYAFGDLG